MSAIWVSYQGLTVVPKSWWEIKKLLRDTFSEHAFKAQRAGLSGSESATPWTTSHSVLLQICWNIAAFD